MKKGATCLTQEELVGTSGFSVSSPLRLTRVGPFLMVLAFVVVGWLVVCNSDSKILSSASNTESIGT